MEENLAQLAINSALCCDWDKAIKINLEIIKENSEDVDALNRLARAYFEKGNKTKAKKTSQEVIKIDPENKIAINSLERYKHTTVTSKKILFTKGKKTFQTNNIVDFIEEPGKTKLTSLINLGSEKVYSSLSSGDEVLLTPHAHKVSVTTMSGGYIGKLTDDLSARLRQLIKGGIKYKIYIKSVSSNCVKIFIKGDTISFPRESSESLSEFGS